MRTNSLLCISISKRGTWHLLMKHCALKMLNLEEVELDKRYM